MKLRDYLIATKLSPAQFANLIDAKSRMTVHRYLAGSRRPCRSMMLRISHVTRGLVTASDFEEGGGAGDAADDLDAAELPWSRSELNEAAAIEAAFRAMLREPLPGTGPSPALRMALFVLGDRVTEKDRRFYLDRRPAGIPTLIRAANRILISEGEFPICYPGVHRPPNGGG